LVDGARGESGDALGVLGSSRFLDTGLASLGGVVSWSWRSRRLPRVLTPLVSAPRPSHFLFARAKEKVTKEKARPTSGSGLRPDFPRSGAAPGAVTKGRPCPFVPRSSSMPRVPLRNTSTRPPDGDRGPSRLEDRSDSPGLRFLLHELTDDIKRPFQVPTSLEKFDAPK